MPTVVGMLGQVKGGGAGGAASARFTADRMTKSTAHARMAKGGGAVRH